jgi:hypothetical protein
MARRGQLFEHVFHRGGQAAQACQLFTIRSEFGVIGQLAVNEQVRDLFELASLRQIQDVVAAIMQIVAGAADGAQRSVAGHDARERHGFFRLRSALRSVAHESLR